MWGVFCAYDVCGVWTSSVLRRFLRTPSLQKRFLGTRSVLRGFFGTSYVPGWFLGISSAHTEAVLRNFFLHTEAIAWNFFCTCRCESLELLPYRSDSFGTFFMHTGEIPRNFFRTEVIPWIFFRPYWGDFLEIFPYWDESLLLCWLVLFSLYFILKMLFFFLRLLLAWNLEVWFACFMMPNSPRREVIQSSKKIF